MRIPLNITITCERINENKIKEFLMPNKLIHVEDIYAGPAAEGSQLVMYVSGVVFEHQDIRLISEGLKHYGNVSVTKGRVRILTLNTILSGLVVAGIVAVALFGHSFNDEFYKQIFEKHNTQVILQTVFVIGSSAVAGFLLEILVVYRERTLR